MQVNGAVFLAWQQPSLQKVMTTHFTGKPHLNHLTAVNIADGQ
jgi:hypothetical protein